MKKLVFSLLMVALACVAQAQKTAKKPDSSNNLCARHVVNHQDLTKTLNKLMVCPGFQLGLANGQTSEFETLSFYLASYNQIGGSVHAYTPSEQDNLIAQAKSIATSNAPFTSDGTKKKDVRSIHFTTSTYTSGSTVAYTFGIEVKYARCDAGGGGARKQN